MNCAEFQEVLPEVFEGDRTAEQESHLQSCSVCSSLVAELDLIANEARQLQEVAEPNPRVWASIEIALRQEGIIHEPQMRPTLLPAVPRRWSMNWLAPVAAAAVIAAGVVVYQRGSAPPSSTPAGPAVAQVVPNKLPITPLSVNDEDRQLLDALASRSPAAQKQYASNLQNVNAYILDAEESAQADPNDEEAQQIVMDAYEQRAAVYEMALDRSMP